MPSPISPVLRCPETRCGGLKENEPQREAAVMGGVALLEKEVCLCGGGL